MPCITLVADILKNTQSLGLKFNVTGTILFSSASASQISATTLVFSGFPILRPTGTYIIKHFITNNDNNNNNLIKDKYGN